ncbi:MAG: ABC transporter substrate-binding protein [Dehalococcoidia bacterium]|nr:ABC transporter substrate-binding protein [Dehalococcoidia bacterium]
MADLRLSFVIREYPHVQPLITGEVKPEGVTLEFQSFEWDAFNKMVRDQAFDVSELSFSLHIQSVALGQSKAQAIPAFVSRHFKHSAWYINTEKGIARPEDLAGRTVGVYAYKMSTALWARAILHHQHGVHPSQIRWITSNPETFAQLPEGVTIELREGADLDAMLATGEIDAMIHPTMPSSFGDPRVRRLFPNFREAEIAYFQQTNIFPIGHVVAIKRSLLADHPWLAQSLFNAFDEARRRSYERQRRHTDFSPLIWAQDYYDQEKRILGDDPLLYGLPRSRASVEAELQFLTEQGLVTRTPTVDELFAPVETPAPVR